MSNLDYKKATFLLSVAQLTQLPPDEGFEVAFIGRSNAGKSSVLNRLTQNLKLARVSKTPGRTQHINVFVLDAQRRLMDLPGYGYAKVPPKVKAHWQKTLDTYLQVRECLQGLVLVMDIRHPLSPLDQHLLTWATACNLRVHILLNKADKLSSLATKKSFSEVSQFIENISHLVSCQTFSASKNTGLVELKNRLDMWFID